MKVTEVGWHLEVMNVASMSLFLCLDGKVSSSTVDPGLLGCAEATQIYFYWEFKYPDTVTMTDEKTSRISSLQIIKIYRHH